MDQSNDSSFGMLPTVTHTARAHSTLPSSRANYIQQHPISLIAKLHTNDEKLIPPVWTRISSTPWDSRAKLLSGGYGIHMHKTKISVDAPKFFFDPHTTYNYDPTMKRESFTRSLSRRKPDAKYEASYVLPGGESVLQATILSRENTANGKNRYQLYPEGKRMHLKNDPTPREATHLTTQQAMTQYRRLKIDMHNTIPNSTTYR